MILYRGWLLLPNDEEGASIMLDAGVWTLGHIVRENFPFIEFEVEVTEDELERLTPYWGTALWGLTPKDHSCL